MVYRPISITPFFTGIRRDRQPFLLENDAYPNLENMYTWRGRLRRRQGFELLGQDGRLRRDFTSLNFFPTSASPWTFNILNIVGFIVNADNANPGQVTTAYAHGLMTGDQVIISNILGATGYNNTVFTITVVDDTNFTVGVDAGAFGAYVSGGVFISDRSLTSTEPNASIVCGSVSLLLGGAITFTDQGDGTLTSVTPGNSGTINYQTGSITLTHTAGASATVALTYSYFPCLPVMGLRTYELPNTQLEDMIGFDTMYAYRFNGAPGVNRWQEITGVKWFGTNSDFFWTWNFGQDASQNNIMWTSNFNIVTPDPLRYYDGTSFIDFQPLVTATETLVNGLIIVSYQSRLVILNTLENNGAANIQFAQRARFSAAGSPIATNAWRQDISGNGGFIDAATNEEIVSACFIRDQLIVYFENSTWALRYTGNEVLPFFWERINASLGSESTFSTIQLDDQCLTFGEFSINTCNGVQVQRIDTKIPDEVYNILNENEGRERVYGIRDYFDKIIYWTFPNDDLQRTFPNRILVYNYEDGSWAFFRDSFTCYGRYRRNQTVRWQDVNEPWNEYNLPWGSSILQSGYPLIIAGNQQGFTLIINQGIDNSVSLHITAISTPDTVLITSPDHNLESDRFIKISGIVGDGRLSMINGGIYIISVVDEDSFRIYTWNTNTQMTNNVTFSGNYFGCGLIETFNNIIVETKRFNILEKGLQVSLLQMDGFVEATENGQFTVLCFNDQNFSVPVNDGTDPFFNTIMETSLNAFDPPFLRKKVSRVQLNTDGQFFAFTLTLSNDQLNNESIHDSVIVLDEMKVWVKEGGSII